MIRRLFVHRFGIVTLIVLMSVGISFITRTVLLVTEFHQLDAHGLDILRIYGAGLIYDLAVAAFLMIPFVMYVALLPSRLFYHRYHVPFVYLFLFAVCYGLLFVAVAEWFFWEEFSVRFNFISVDYLIYRREVTGNIYESYPVIPILAVIAVVAGGILFAVRGAVSLSLCSSPQAASTLRTRLATAGLLFLFPVLAYFGLPPDLKAVSKNSYQNELASNGIYQFVYAFQNNQLDYNQFYVEREDRQISNVLRQQVAAPGASFLTQTPFDLTRRIDNPGQEKHLNVFLIVVESLSAAYLGVFGNTEHLTPHLDALADNSLFFTNFYATGTRTVRGLEAVALSIPPTPGQSIIKRPHNENLFSLGFIFRDKGYDTKFIYGGYGYFDNMNYFFEHNGFDIVDRTALTREEIASENVWGVADESILGRALREANDSYQRKKPFFSLIMTTSNHRPYTYPAGRIDIPTGSRSGGVKYTDYAIHAFLDAAKQQPWFQDTVFVIVADHCASSAGKVDLPIPQYHIPLFIYAPKHVKPAKIARLSSQIDVAPTLLALLNFDYTSRFFGKDILAMHPNDERAFISNYQKLGLYKNNALVVLSPQRKVEIVAASSGQAVSKASHDDPLLAEALGYYQGAYHIYTQDLHQRIQETHLAKSR